MLSRNITTVKTNISIQILEVPVVGNHPARIKVERSVVTVVIPTFQSIVLPMAKNVSNARRRIISQNFVKVQIKCLSRKDIHEVEKSKFEYDTDIVEFKQIQFSTPVFSSRKDSLNSQNIMFDEVRVKETTLSPNQCMFREQSRNFFMS